jgi:hypothetical protein
MPHAPTCRCGHDIGHPLVHLVPRYGPFALLWLMAGASARPKSAAYTCRRCQSVLAVTRDPAVLRQIS